MRFSSLRTCVPHSRRSSAPFSPRRSVASLVRIVAVAFVWMALLTSLSARPAVAQDDPAVQSRHVDVTAADLKPLAKSSPDLRVDDVITLKRGADRGTITSQVLEMPFAFNGLAPHWDAATAGGDPVPPDAIHVEVRTSHDGAEWTRWTPTGHPTRVEATIKSTGEPNPHAGDVSAGYVLTEPGSRYAQFRVTLRGTSAVPVLKRISLYVVRSTGGPSAPDPSLDDAYNERLHQRETPKSAVRKSVAKPRIYTRSEWGAQAPSGGYAYQTADHLGMHHSASTSDGSADTWSKCAAAVRGIQDYHMYTNGWTDIGYNYVVCQTGHVFQGREDGNDGSDVVGAHDSANYGSVGVDGLGYFHSPYNQVPTQSMLDGFAELFAWIADRRGIDPSGASYYSGYGGTVDNVYGHRDVYATACPGDNLYTKIPDVISRINTILSGGGTRTLTAAWQRNGASGGRPSWFATSGSTERGLAYGRVGGNDRLFVVSRKSGSAKVHVLDAADGSDVTTLSTSGVSGGVYALNDVEASSDGVILAANLTTDASQSAFRIYRWDGEADTPSLVATYSGASLRLGDHITVRGSTSDNSLEIWAPAGGSDRIVRFTTADGGQSFSASTVTVNAMGSTPSVGAFSQYVFVGSAGVGASAFNDSGSLRGTVPAAAIPSTTGGLKTFADFSGTSVRKYAAVFDYVSGSAHGGKLRLVDVTDGAASATLEDDTPWLGGADNPNGTGDVAVKSDGNGAFTIFVLSTNNGLAAYETGTSKLAGPATASTADPSWIMSEAYPNPSDTQARIDVELPEAASVRVEVYDVLGRRVMSRDYGRIGQGERSLSVPTGTLASGAYVYRIHAGSRTAEGSMRVVR